jgi:hypothetical protein
MWEKVGILWWFAGASILTFVGPMFYVGHLFMIVIDHRRHWNWHSTVLAIIWPILCVAMVGVLQTNMSPPLFGIPILFLFSMAWIRNKWLFTSGVASYYCLSTLVLISAVISRTEIHWWFLVFWPISFVVLILWRKARIAALHCQPVMRSIGLS